MEKQGKAIYNALKMAWEEDPSIDVEGWEVLDYRSLPEATLFQMLQPLGIDLNSKDFASFAKEAETPEDLTLMLTEEEGESQLLDQTFLIIFELWRRKFPEVPSLSIFCDQLDHLINLYYIDGQSEILTSHLNALEGILDSEESPKETFSLITSLCGNDLETFLYDFISDLIHSQEPSLASDRLEEFYDLVDRKGWFDLLHIELVNLADPAEAHHLLLRLIEDAKGEKNIDLLLAIVQFLIASGDPKTFVDLAHSLLPLIPENDPESLIDEMLEASKEFYMRIDHDEEERVCQNLLKEGNIKVKRSALNHLLAKPLRDLPPQFPPLQNDPRGT